jgi:PKD repeat protein
VDETGVVGSPVSFAGEAMLSGCLDDPTYSWDFGDGAGDSDETTTHTYSAPGTYEWALTVTSGTEICIRTGTVEIAPVEPQCSLSCDAEVRRYGTVHRRIEFHGESATEDCSGSPLYEWDFGDGSAPAYGREVEHRYHAVSVFTWRLMVLQDGATCETTGTISISGGHSEVD